LLVISTKPIPVLLVKNLEKRYISFNDATLIDSTKQLNILILAAGHTDDESLQPNNQLSAAGLGRLTEGIRLHKKIPGSRLILSGPGGKSGFTQAEVLLRTALIIGVEEKNVSFLDNPKNTNGEAVEYIEKFGKEDQLIVVSSAIHMPRIMMIFQRAGLDPIPAPTNNILKYGSKKSPWRWVPGAENVKMMEAAVHEWVGLVWAWAGGR